MVPLVAILRNTDTVVVPLLVTTRSAFPSPSKSPMATQEGMLPGVKSTFEANDVAVMMTLLALDSRTV